MDEKKTEGRLIAEVELENGKLAWAEDSNDLPTHMFRIMERSRWVYIFTPEELAARDERVARGANKRTLRRIVEWFRSLDM